MSLCYQIFKLSQQLNYELVNSNRTSRTVNQVTMLRRNLCSSNCKNDYCQDCYISISQSEVAIISCDCYNCILEWLYVREILHETSWLAHPLGQVCFLRRTLHGLKQAPHPQFTLFSVAVFTIIYCQKSGYKVKSLTLFYWNSSEACLVTAIC